MKRYFIKAESKSIGTFSTPDRSKTSLLKEGLTWPTKGNYKDSEKDDGNDKDDDKVNDRDNDKLKERLTHSCLFS